MDPRLPQVSPAVARILARHPDLVDSVTTALPDAEVLLVEARRVAADALTRPDPPAAIRRGLRRLKYAVVGGLVLRDLEGGTAAVEGVTAALADLADALVDASIEFAAARLASRHGRPPSWPTGGGFVAIAMGKHGGRELNYSSDIDLVWVVADHEGSTDGDKPISTQRWAERMGGEVAGILADRTEDGFCFRVDLALRPDGRAGPPTTTLAAAEQYYLTYGRTWERAAWLKARPCGGDLQLGAELLRRIEPFRFRRSMDFGTLQDLGAMRDRITDAARADDLEADLKRGPGGIREVEFLVQAQQLVWAGRDPELRVRGTLEALRLLAEKGGLPPDLDVDRLGDAYRYLRAVEHRLQWPDEAQTQRLPPPDADSAWTALASAMGHADVDELKQRLACERAFIESAWSGLLSGVATLSGSFPALVDPFAEPRERRRDLAALGFKDPVDAERRLVALARASGRKRMRPEAWRRFERVAPRLLLLASASSDPDAALARVETFVGRVGARSTTYALLHENPPVVQTLVRLFAESGYLSELLCAHPELLDALVLRGRGGERPPQGPDALWTQLEPQLLAREDPDDAMLALRTFHTSELLRVGLADLGHAPRADRLPCPHLTALARTCVRGAAALALRRMAERHGELPAEGEGARPMAVLGLGSLGSGWMTYGSDLDLVFVYGADRRSASSTGARPLDATTWTARWSQRVITVLSAPTREGRCYDVDMRLRPDGSGGSLVVPLDGFADYYATRARPWERIALCRASVAACEDPEFAAAIEDVLAAARSQGADDRRTSVAEVRRMRALQMREIAREAGGRVNLKTGAGGLTDVEFAVACVQVTRKAGHPATTLADPLEALAVLTQTGDLSARAADEMAAGYRLLRLVEARLRLRSGRGADALVFPSEEADKLAAALGMGSAVGLHEELAARRDAIARRSSEVLADLEEAEIG